MEDTSNWREFFKDDGNNIHGSRIVGLLYIVFLPFDFGQQSSVWACIATLCYTAGWWMTCCHKQRWSLSQMADSRHIAGIALAIGGLAAKLYFLAHK